MWVSSGDYGIPGCLQCGCPVVSVVYQAVCSVMNCRLTVAIGQHQRHNEGKAGLTMHDPFAIMTRTNNDTDVVAEM